jgi:hypothetical protein
MKDEKYDRITIRFDRVVGRKIRALAKRRGLSVAAYCKLMCSLEILNDDPDLPVDVRQQFKEVLGDIESFGQLDPQRQVDVMRRSLDAITAVRKAADQAFTWMNALVRASDAFTRQKGARPDASADAGGPGTPDAH